MTTLPPPNLTDQQAAVLDLFKRMTAEHPQKRPPTMRAMAAALGVSVTTVFGHVNELIRKGRLRRTEKWRARNLHLVADPREELLYRMARHVRNAFSGKSWDAQTVALLSELRDLDPVAYHRHVVDA